MNIILFQTNKCIGFINSNEFEPNTGLLFIELKFYVKFKLNAKEGPDLSTPSSAESRRNGVPLTQPFPHFFPFGMAG